MTFKSRRDRLFQLMTFGFSAVFIGIVLFQWSESGIENSPSFLSNILLLAIVGFLLWSHFDTTYELTKTELKYKSGILRGTIQIKDISEIIKGKTLWSGFKAATARHGVIVKYNQYDEIYISPKTNDTFVAKLLELNTEITITTHSNS
jgi:hypothetical protein